MDKFRRLKVSTAARKSKEQDKKSKMSRLNNFKNTKRSAEAERMKLLKNSGVLDDFIAQSRKDFTSGLTVNNTAIQNLLTLKNKIAKNKREAKKTNEPSQKNITVETETEDADDVIESVEKSSDIINLEQEPSSENSGVKNLEPMKIGTLKRSHSDEDIYSDCKKRCLLNLSATKEPEKLCHLSVNIVSGNNSNLTQDQCFLIKNEVEKRLCQFIADPENNLAPVFEHSPEIVRQAVTLACYDEYTYGWLVKTVASITELWEGCALKVVLAAAMKIPMPVGTVVIPDAEGTIDYIKAHLDRMNSRWFNMSQWSIINHRVKGSEDEKTTIIDLSLPKSDLDVLRRRDFKICYKLGVIDIVMSPDTEN